MYSAIPLSTYIQYNSVAKIMQIIAIKYGRTIIARRTLPVTYAKALWHSAVARADGAYDM